MVDEQEFWNRKFDDTVPSSAPHRTQRGAFTVPPLGVRQRLLDRFQDWRSDPRAGVVVLVVVAVVAGIVWYRIGVGGGADAGAAPRPVATTRARAATSADPETRTATTSAASTEKASSRLAVHVAGAVTHPGVVDLAAGSRVIDAVEAVGGASVDADLDRLNLAAKVADGERVYVPKVGQPDPGVVAGDGAAAAGVGADDATPDRPLNLNTATAAQLEDLPGIGPAYAEAIIDERQRRGGFTSVNELRSVRGIGEKRFAQLAPLVAV